MNFTISCRDVGIESFSETTVSRAIKYVKSRYLNNGAGCSLIYFVYDENNDVEDYDGDRVEVTVNPKFPEDKSPIEVE